MNKILLKVIFFIDFRMEKLFISFDLELINFNILRLVKAIGLLFAIVEVL